LFKSKVPKARKQILISLSKVNEDAETSPFHI